MATKCANCPEPAVYTVSDPGALPADFCAADLPAHLQARADAGEFAAGKTAAPKANAEPEPDGEK